MGLSGRPFRSIMLSCYPASCHEGQHDLSLRPPERKSYKIQRRARNFMDIKQKGPLPCLLFAAPFFGIFMARGCVRFCRGEERNALDSVPYLISPPSFRQIFSSACFFAFSFSSFQNEMAPIPQSRGRRGHSLYSPWTRAFCRR